MAMADAPGPVGPHAVPDPDPGDQAAAPALSWAEQETLDALKRLARAQSNLEALESQAGPAAPRLDPDAVTRLERVHAELLEAREKASGRFARGAARERADQLETTERLVLSELGQPDYDSVRSALASSRAAEPTVDPQVLAFARQELVSARQAWIEVQAMAVPDPDPDEPPVAPTQAPGVGPDVA